MKDETEIEKRQTKAFSPLKSMSEDKQSTFFERLRKIAIGKETNEGSTEHWSGFSASEDREILFRKF